MLILNHAFQQFKNTFFPTISKDDKTIFFNNLNFENYQRAKLGLTCLILLSILFPIIDLLNNDLKVFILCLHLSFICIVVIFFVVFIIFNPKGEEEVKPLHQYLVLVAASSLLVWLSFISGIEKNVQMFIVSIFTLSTLLYFSNFKILLLYSLAYLSLFTINKGRLIQSTITNYQLFLALYFTAWLISRLLFYTKLQYFLIQSQLNVKNNQLIKKTEEYKQLSEELDNRVLEKTKVLASANTFFKKEIKERRLIENQLLQSKSTLKEQNNELRKVNEELDKFVYSVSHDLRAPLASVLGLIEIGKDEESIDRFREYNYLIGKSIRKLDNFINDILNYSQNSRKEIIAEQIDFKNIISEIFEGLEYLQNQYKVTPKLRILGSDNFYSDKMRLKIILNNLISNAYRYSRPKEDAFVEVNIEKLKDNVKIEIKDNGQGIPKEHIGKIFDMFHRASENSKGSGLGLYIVKEAIKVLNGNISVDSKINQGTSFFLTIPQLEKTLR